MARVFLLTAGAMIAFAGNSLLCRSALRQTSIDAASFTFVRILSGAVLLGVVMKLRGTSRGQKGDWLSAFSLFIYAAAFSFAYRNLAAGTGALLLFGAVQATMLLWGLHKGERLRAQQIVGLAVAVIGLVVLLRPGLAAPSPLGSILMLGAGFAWAIYSLRGKGAEEPLSATAGNFLRAVPIALASSVIFLPVMHLDSSGIAYAVISGTITSGLGYVIWYSALPELKATSAATVQLSVPVLTATGGMMFLGEPVTVRFLLAAAAILGGVAAVLLSTAAARSKGQT